MMSIYIKGEKISLRALEKTDINENYLKWINDPEINQYMESGSYPTNMESLYRFFEGSQNSSTSVLFAIIENLNGSHIGNVKIDSIHWIHRRAILGIMIGEKSEHGKGYGTEATKLALTYAFKMLNLEKIKLGVIASNYAAINIYEKIGFKRVGLLIDEFYYHGDYHDMVYLEIHKKDYVE